jgi:hypothetical protein
MPFRVVSFFPGAGGIPVKHRYTRDMGGAASPGGMGDGLFRLM